jgi:preprotein translocase subunit Sec61beta
MGGAGLIRFYQDSSNGIKVGPVATIVFAVILEVVVILAHADVFGWLTG